MRRGAVSRAGPWVVTGLGSAVPPGLVVIREPALGVGRPPDPLRVWLVRIRIAPMLVTISPIPVPVARIPVLTVGAGIPIVRIEIPLVEVRIRLTEVRMVPGGIRIRAAVARVRLTAASVGVVGLRIGLTGIPELLVLGGVRPVRVGLAGGVGLVGVCSRSAGIVGPLVRAVSGVSPRIVTTIAAPASGAGAAPAVPRARAALPLDGGHGPLRRRRAGT
ncbi:hypothetical protein FraQA3DRAFT_4892 [Frankia sp. QA3]|nr:hypothetical protein FraQA3DRAFT_4892 [Frankia sp. QA3]